MYISTSSVQRGSSCSGTCFPDVQMLWRQHIRHGTETYTWAKPMSSAVLDNSTRRSGSTVIGGIRSDRAQGTWAHSTTQSFIHRRPLWDSPIILYFRHGSRFTRPSVSVYASHVLLPRTLCRWYSSRSVVGTAGRECSHHKQQKTLSTVHMSLRREPRLAASHANCNTYENIPQWFTHRNVPLRHGSFGHDHGKGFLKRGVCEARHQQEACRKVPEQYFSRERVRLWHHFTVAVTCCTPRGMGRRRAQRSNKLPDALWLWRHQASSWARARFSFPSLVSTTCVQEGPARKKFLGFFEW